MLGEQKKKVLVNKCACGLFETREKVCVGIGRICFPNVLNVCRCNMWQQDFFFCVSTCFRDLHAHSRTPVSIFLQKTSLSCTVCLRVCSFFRSFSERDNLSQCSSPALCTSHPSPTVTRWPIVDACQGLCGLRRAVQRFPFPGALGTPAWPPHTVFMFCVIADLSLSGRPASVKKAMCSL